MPSYQLLNIADQARAVAAEIESAKDAGNYDARADFFDKRMGDRLQKAGDIGVKWTMAHDKKVSSALTSFKKQFEKYAKLDKKKAYDKKSVDELKQVVLSINNNIKMLKQDSADMSKATVTQYRKNDWINVARAAMNDDRIVTKIQNERKDGISVSETSAKNRKILETISKQLTLFYKKGLAKVKGEGNMGGIVADIDGLVASMEQQKVDNVEDNVYKGSQGLSILGLIQADIKKGKAPRKDDINGFKANVKKFDPAIKGAKDALKIMMTEAAILKKRASSIKGMDSMAKPALKQAETIIKASNKIIADMAKQYKNAEKDFKKIEKGL